MIKRNDLVKQFELVVKQEIINHNDQILASNLAVNEIRKSLDEVIANQGLVNSEFGSIISKIQVNGVELSGGTLKLCKKLSSFMQDMAEFREQVKGELLIAVENAVSNASKYERLLNNTESWHASLEDLSDSVTGLSFNFSREIEEAKQILKKEIKKSKDEILSMPSEAQAVKKELEEKMAVDRVDFAGVMRELQIMKKDNFIKDKKIENLYTLIERLEKKTGG